MSDVNIKSWPDSRLLLAAFAVLFDRTYSGGQYIGMDATAKILVEVQRRLAESTAEGLEGL